MCHLRCESNFFGRWGNSLHNKKNFFLPKNTLLVYFEKVLFLESIFFFVCLFVCLEKKKKKAAVIYITNLFISSLHFYFLHSKSPCRIPIFLTPRFQLLSVSIYESQHYFQTLRTFLLGLILLWQHR
jgi:hypothetical protein